MLSQHMIVGTTREIPSSQRRELTHMISTVALVSDLYSLSVEARAAVVSFFVNQEIRLLPWYTRYPLVEHWSSGQPANHYLKKR